MLRRLGSFEPVRTRLAHQLGRESLLGVVGLLEPSQAQGLGLVIMRERAQGVGGQLRIDALPGRGTRIELDLPYDRQLAD